MSHGKTGRMWCRRDMLSRISGLFVWIQVSIELLWSREGQGSETSIPGFFFAPQEVNSVCFLT